MKSLLKNCKILFLFCFIQLGFAQQKTVSGTVSDSKGLALSGVTISVIGTKVQSQSDFDGKFSISANEGSKLLFKFLGSKTTTITVAAANSYKIVMENDNQVLEEVVIVGYGTQKRKEVTGAISTVKGDKLAAIKGQSFDQALAGQVAGVNASTPNGVLGNQAVIRVRGVNSISLSNYPLLVIDGVPTWNGDNINQTQAANNPLSSMNPNDIESLEVLKDAAASAIYGSRASAGVILITTKKVKKVKHL
jgi:TonB-dependent SusC/RagA subfamily outer membrane receptor